MEHSKKVISLINNIDCVLFTSRNDETGGTLANALTSLIKKLEKKIVFYNYSTYLTYIPGFYIMYVF